MEQEVTAGSWRELLGARFALPALTLCLGEGIYAFNSFLVSTALPSAVLDLQGVDLIAWAFTVYLTAAIVGGAAGGLLKQALGARRALLLPAGLFLIGTLACAFASSMVEVLAGRLLQGAGEGIIAALCYVLAAELFPRTLLPKMFGALAVMWAVASFSGPLVSGFLTETFTWRAAFLVNVPMILAFALLVIKVAPSARGALPRRPPFLRLLLIAAGVMTIGMAGRVQGLPAALLLLGLALVLLLAGFAADRRSATKLFPRQAFRPRDPVGAALWVVLLMPLAGVAAAVYLPLFLQAGWGWRPTYAGAMVALMALSWSGVAILVANVTRGHWPSTFITMGPLLVVLALAMQALAVPAEAAVVVALAQLVMGAGFGMNWGFISQAVMEAADADEKDMASGLLPTVQSAGYAIGSAAAGVAAHMAGLGQGSGPIEQAGLWIFGVHALFAVPAILLARRVRLARL